MLSEENKAQGWLMIIYRVPSSPSTSRVMVWKRVKELGAHLLQQSVYILPNRPSVKDSVTQLKDQIDHLGGESKIIEIASLGEEQETEVIAGFNSSREEEYTEVVKSCNEFLQEIEEESKTKNFRFADFEENGKHLQRVKELLDTVRSRDYFSAPIQAKTIDLFEECRLKFEAFSHEVYCQEGIEVEQKKTALETAAKQNERHLITKQTLINKMVEIANGLASGNLKVDGKTVGNLPDSIVLEWELKDQRNEKSLEIKIGWRTSSSGKKS